MIDKCPTDRHSCRLSVGYTVVKNSQYWGDALVNEDEVRPYAESGIWTLDGNGNATGVISGSIDGVPFATRQAFTATYEHVADCVYAVVDEFDLQVDLYTTPTGTPMTYFSPGFSGTHLKQ